jgi:DNA-binding LacI/PurR family transcriptional regulator
MCIWAASLIKALRVRGIRVPDDVAVVGYLNHYLADWTDPTLTTIDVQHETATNAMVAMLERMIESGPLPKKERVLSIQPKLIVRDST